MSWLSENKLIIFINYVNMIFILTVMKACYRIQQFNYMLITVLYLSGIVLYAMWSIIKEKKKYSMIATIIIFIMIAAIIILKKAEILNFYYDSIQANIVKINTQLYAGADTYFFRYKPFFMILMPAIAFILSFLNSKGINNGIIVLNLSAMIFFWYLEYVDEVKGRLVIFVILCITTYGISSYMKNIKALGRMGIHISLDKNKIIGLVVVYSIVIALIGAFLPQWYEGKYSSPDNRRWNNPFAPDALDSMELAKKGKYNISSSGYNNTEIRLGGPVKLNEKLYFKVDADAPFYLRGDVRDTYTGSAWKKELEQYDKRSNISDNETNIYISNLLGVIDSNSRRTITIYPQKINSSTLFVPIYPLSVSLEKGNVYFEKNGKTFANSGRVVRQYSVTFYDPEAVKFAIEKNSDFKDISFSRTKYEKYLELPDSITERTVQLVYSIVKDAKTNYEKVERIKKYLSDNYQYSLNVSQVPQGVDFVDYFLFTEKKGYCVYFATAMTVMTRIAGIPARYVEGFKMPSTTVKGYYNVTGEQAHAWSEVILQEGSDIWMTEDCSTTPAEARQKLSTPRPSSSSDAGELPIPTLFNHHPAQTSDSDVKRPGVSKTQIIISPKMIVIGCILAAMLLAAILRVYMFMKKKKRLLFSESTLPIYNYIMKRFRSVGMKKSELITEMEFAKEMSDSALRIRLIELIDKVYGEFYGGIKADEYDKVQLYEFVENYIRSKQDPIKYYFVKYFL